MTYRALCEEENGEGKEEMVVEVQVEPRARVVTANCDQPVLEAALPLWRRFQFASATMPWSSDDEYFDSQAR